jgi:glutaredoxin-like YruB-family protein
MRILITVLTLLLTFSLAEAGTKPVTGSGQDARTVVAAKTRFSGVVEIYVTDWCGYCKKAINYMKSHNIRYVAYDVEKDDAARERHRELGGRGVPLIIIGSNKMSGFSAENLEYYLDNSE